jgi:hypothetical protein
MENKNGKEERYKPGKIIYNACIINQRTLLTKALLFMALVYF